MILPTGAWKADVVSRVVAHGRFGAPTRCFSAPVTHYQSS